MESVIRAQAAQAVIDKYFDKSFLWGKRDCVHLASRAIIELGHPDPLSGVKHYNTPLGARKAMKAAGVKDFAEHIDNLGFERIGYASALPGDLVGFRGQFHGADEESVALGIAIGNGRIVGYASGVCGFADAVAVQCTHAWRVPVLRGIA